MDSDLEKARALLPLPPEVQAMLQHMEMEAAKKRARRIELTHKVLTMASLGTIILGVNCIIYIIAQGCYYLDVPAQSHPAWFVFMPHWFLLQFSANLITLGIIYLSAAEVRRKNRPSCLYCGRWR